MQLHLFDVPLSQRIEEVIGEAVEDYFITGNHLIDPESNQYFRQCTVLTKKAVYLTSISEDDSFDSVILHKADRKELHRDFIRDYFAKNKKLFKGLFVE